MAMNPTEVLSRGAMRFMPRDRLRLPAAEDRPRLTIVRAPAGFGKTTLLRQWFEEARAGGSDAVWLTLDASYRSPARFAAHLRKEINDLSRTRGVQDGDIVDRVVRHIEQSGRPLVLIFDELETVSSGDSLDLLRRIVRLELPRLSVVASGRTIPALGQARLSLSSEVRELSGDDLRFDSGEARSLFANRLGEAITEEQANVLAGRLDGWAAGLQIACLALRDRSDVAGFLADAVTQRLVFDYLREDIFGQLDEELRAFLLAVSPFKYLTGDLCDAVTGSTGGAATLAQIEEAGLFLTRVGVDSNGATFRFHDVFAEFLRDQLALEGMTRLSELRRSASQFYAARGQWHEAIEQMALTGDREEALTLLEKVCVDYVGWGQFEALAAWNGRMTLAEGRRHPYAFASWLWTEMFFGNTALVTDTLQRFERDTVCSATLPADLRDYLCSLEIVNAGAEDRFAEVRERGDDALASMNSGKNWATTSLANMLGFAHLAGGNLAGARKSLEMARRSARTSDRSLNHAYSDVVEGMAHMLDLRLGDATAVLRQAFRRASAERGLYSNATGLCAAMLSEALYESDQLDEAEQVLAGRIETVSEAGFPDLILVINVTAAKIAVARGDRAAAHQLLAQADAVCARRGLPRVSATLRWERARIALLAGDVEQSLRLERDIEPPVGDDHLPYYDVITRDIAPTRLRLLRGETHGVCAQLVTLIARSKRLGLRRRNHSLAILNAMALQLDGRADAAVVEMGRALRLGLPAGFLRSFLDEGPLAVGIIKEAMHSLSRTDPYMAPYLARLEEALGSSSGEATPIPSISGEMRTRLTGREAEIIDIAARGLTNVEIGHCLNLSEPTVKWHLQNAFRKLGVNTRTEAIFLTR